MIYQELMLKTKASLLTQDYLGVVWSLLFSKNLITFHLSSDFDSNVNESWFLQEKRVKSIYFLKLRPPTSNLWRAQREKIQNTEISHMKLF